MRVPEGPCVATGTGRLSVSGCESFQCLEEIVQRGALVDVAHFHEANDASLVDEHEGTFRDALGPEKTIAHGHGTMGPEIRNDGEP